jgi:hypothetical protein
MKKYKIQNRSQTNSHSCVALRAKNKDYYDVHAMASSYIFMSNKHEGTTKFNVVKKKVFEKVGVMAPSLETGSSQLTSQYAQLSFRKTSISFFSDDDNHLWRFCKMESINDGWTFS